MPPPPPTASESRRTPGFSSLDGDAKKMVPVQSGSAESIGSTVSTKTSAGGEPERNDDAPHITGLSQANLAANLSSPQTVEGLHSVPPPVLATERAPVALPTYVFKKILAEFQEPGFQRFVQRWAFRNCEDFPVGKDEVGDALAWEQAEHKLHWTGLHREYRNIFEDRAQKVLKDYGFEVSAVLDQLQRITKGRGIRKSEI